MKRIYVSLLVIAMGALLLPALWFSMKALATSQAWSTQTPRHQLPAKEAKESKLHSGSAGSAKGISPNVLDALNFSAGKVFNFTSVFVPMVTATKSATLATDVNGNTFVNPGDTLMYSVVVGNAGMDAMNVIFTDQLNANLTLSGVATASPIATNDAYNVLGNVRIQVPAGNGLLANDVNPQGTGTISATSFTPTSAQGGNVIVSVDGSFSYNPPPGYEGTDSFTYTLTHSNGKTDMATVTLTVTGMIWFIDNNAAACTTLAAGCGRLTNPFSSVAAFQALNNGTGNNPAAGDNIFLYRIAAGNYTGPLTLLNNQKLGGQGMTVSLSSFTGLTPPTFSDALPTTSGTRPIIRVQNGGGNNLTLGQNNTLRGFNLETSATGMGGNTIGTALLGSNFGNLTASEISIDSSAGAAGNCVAAVNLNTGNPTASFTSIAANNCVNGIVLASTTGSFTVTGDGTNLTLGGNGSGGTIQNTTGAGISLSSTVNVQLNYVNITNAGTDSIRITDINGFTFNRSNISDSAGTAPADKAIDIGDFVTGTPVNGTINITNSILGPSSGNSPHDTLAVGISSGTSTWNITGSTFRRTGNSAISWESRGSSVVTVDVTGCTFAGANTAGSGSPSARGIFVNNLDDSVITLFDIHSNTFTNNNIHIDMNQQNDTDPVGSHTFKIRNNTTMTGARSHAINVFAAAGSFAGTFNGTLDGNTIGNSGVANSGSEIGNGIRVNINGGSDATMLLNNNTIRQTPNGRGIEIISRNGTGGLDVTVTNNNVNPQAVANPLAAILIQSNAVTVANSIRADVRGNTVPAANDVADFLTTYLELVQSNGSTFQFVDTTAPISGTAASELAATNTGSTGTLGTITLIAGPITTPPPIAQPIETDEQLKQGSGNSAQRLGGDNNSPSLSTRIGQWLRPVFSAFAAPTNLSLKALGNWFSPAASAAEFVVPPSGGSDSTAKPIPTKAGTTNVPARTMLVNSKGETRIVPTASLAAMAGDLITINGTGSGFTLPAGESTTIMFNATIGSGFTGTAITNQASVSGTGFGPILSNNLSTPVIQAPTFSKAFSPTTIATNTGVSALTFTLTNPNPSQALSGVAFSDTLPAGVIINTPNGITNTCGGTSTAVAGSGSISLSAGAIAAGASCTLKVDVKATSEGPKNNLSGNVTTTESNQGGTASATLTVINAPSFSKAFGAASVPLNGSTSLTFTITNNSATSALSGVTFTDTLPAGLVVATPNGFSTTCSGTQSATAGGSSISLSGASLAISGSCTLTVNVTGTTAGAKPNSATLATTELGANSAATGTVTLNVFAPPTVTKAFSPTSIPVNGTSTLTITITNPAGNPGALNGISISDSFPAGVEVDATPMAANTCGGTFSPTAGATSISLTGGAIATAGNSCSISVKVKGTTAGAKNNITGTVSSTEGGTGLTANATLNVFAPPTVAKSFSPTGVAVGGTSTLTITFTNPAGNPGGLNGIGIVDNFPAGLEVNTTPGATNTCGGTFSPVAAATSITLSGGAIGSAGGTCSISVSVKATTSGSKVNLTNAVTSTEGGTGGTATATLIVATPPTFSKSFSPTSIPLNGTSTLTFNITNPNGAISLNNISFSDSFPAGVEVDATPSPTNTCGGTFTTVAAATSVSLSGASLAGGASCSLSVKVKGTTAGVKNNVSGAISSTESGAGGTASASLTVVGPPAFTKAFTPTSVALGGMSTLNFTITNNNTTSALNGIGFTDVLPAGLSVSDATTNNVCGSGSVLTVVAATRTITLTGGNLAVGSPVPTTCTIPVTVTGITAGAQVNTTQAITSTEGGTGGTATATLNVFAPPTISKAFSPTGVQVGGTSTLTITITNPAANPGALTGVGVVDNFPAGVEVHTTPGATNTCGGTFSPAAMATSITLSGGSIAANSSCSISVTVKGTTAGVKNNTTNAVTSTNGGTGNTASATLTVAAAPTVSKSFSPTSIPVNGTSTLTINFTNPNAFSLSGLAISDSFPAGVEVAATPAATNTCGGTFTPVAAATSISLSGGSLTSSGSCSISVAVRGTTAGAKNNVTGNVSTTESGAGGTANAILNVFAPPTLSKVFVPTSIAVNGQSTLNIVITNPAGNPGGLTGIAISDSFPAGLEVSSPLVSNNTCGGTFSPTAGATNISLSGGAIASAGSSCTISVNVRGTTAGAKANTTGAVSSTEGGTGLTASATLNVFAAPTITKAFSPTGISVNGTSTLTITITNPAANPAGINGVAVSDTFPAGMEVNTTPGATNTCGGTFNPVAAATSISLTGGAIATAGGSCSISVVVKGTTAGVKNNTTGTVSSTEGGTGLTASATLTVAAAPTVAKSFSPTSIVLNGTSTLTINFTNPNAFALTGLAISDSFPAGVEVAATPAATNTCGGTFAPTAAATSISLSGGSLTSSGSCSISVAVKGTTAGAKNNVTGNVSTTESGAGGTANATLNVFAPPTITKAFSPTTIALNGTSTLTLTITNPAANPAGVNGVAVSDTFPAGLVVHTTPGATNTCGGSFVPTAGATNIALTGGVIASAGGSCSVSVTVRGTTSGAKANTTGAVSSTEGGAGLTASATLNVFAPPTVTKAFSPNSIQLNNTSTLTITITNPAGNPAGITGVAISDSFPAGMEVAAVPAATNTCGGTFTPVAAATSINLTGGAIASAGGSCSISVSVKGTTQGLKTNTTGAVSSTEGGAGLTATATLDVITCNSIVCPSDVFVGTTGNSAVVNYPAPSPNGICGTITCTPASGTAFNVGTTTVTCNSSIGNQSCSFNVTVNRVSGTASDPLACTGPGNTVQATLVISNNGNVNQAIVDNTTFTNLVGVPNTCTVSPNVGTCTVTNGGLTYNGNLTPGQTVTLTYLTQVSDLAASGAQVCTNNSVAFNGGTPFAFSACGTANCPAQGPGNPFPARSEASDQGAGSVLIYNVYTSSASAPNTQNTKVSLTNTHPLLPSTVHLFFVDGTSCSIADSYVCLTANQTSSFLMSDIDPGTTGYLVAVATNTLGCPINFNFLVGDEYVKFASGHAANLGAQAYSAIPGGLVACDQNSVTATLNFDGVSYDRTGRTLALDSLGSKADGNDTMLILNRIGGNLGTGAATLSAIFGIFYDDSENSVSFSVAGSCQLRSSISNNFPRTTPRFETFIPAGRTGWMKFFSQSDIGISGAAINFNSNATASAGAFNQGHNLHVLTLSSAASYVIPIFPPSC